VKSVGYEALNRASEWIALAAILAVIASLGCRRLLLLETWPMTR
jgi:hypothetical protein